MTCSDVSVVDVIMFSSHFSQLSLCYIVIIINIINVSVCVYTRVCLLLFKGNRGGGQTHARASQAAVNCSLRKVQSQKDWEEDRQTDRQTDRQAESLSLKVRNVFSLFHLLVEIKLKRLDMYCKCITWFRLQVQNTFLRFSSGSPQVLLRFFELIQFVSLFEFRSFLRLYLLTPSCTQTFRVLSVFWCSDEFCVTTLIFTALMR